MGAPKPEALKFRLSLAEAPKKVDIVINRQILLNQYYTKKVEFYLFT